MTYVVGQKLYRVVNNLHADLDTFKPGEQPEWLVEERTVTKVGPKTIVLDRPFTGSMTLGRVSTFDADRSMYASAIDAVRAFDRNSRSLKQQAQQRLVSLNRDLVWSEHELLRLRREAK